MKCKNLKIRSKNYKNYLYCSKQKTAISWQDCNCCILKEYKQYKPMKLKSKKLTSRENKRFSIIYHDLTKCCVCGLKSGDYDNRISLYTRIEKNEIFSGSYRTISMEDGMVAPMCIYCHKKFHSNAKMNLEYKAKFQKEYLKQHSLDDFIKRYGENYIYKLEQKKEGTDN